MRRAKDLVSLHYGVKVKYALAGGGGPLGGREDVYGGGRGPGLRDAGLREAGLGGGREGREGGADAGLREARKNVDLVLEELRKREREGESGRERSG